jgi:ABC-type multidrug transport system fused ATPase/permease subunit
VLALGTLQIVFVISFFLPMLLLPFIPVIAFTVWVAYQYLVVSRELKRLESLKQSPVFVLFSESLAGLSIIRSFRQESRFFKNCCQRVDAMNQCHLYLWLCNRWLNFRMQLLGSLVAGSVGFAVILYEDSLSSTAAAIVIIYSLTFCDYLTFLARAHADVSVSFLSIFCDA